MKIELDKLFITDNSKECEKDCFWVKTAQNAKFEDAARKMGAKIINLNEAKKLLKIDENIQIIGITGTNGKTTTAAIIAHLLNALGFKTALCGTRGAFIDKEIIANKGLTTAAILQTLNFLALATQKKCKFFVMEVSSHALSQNRIQSLKFRAKIYTNLSQDHLDFHKDFTHYKAAKESFFEDDTLKFINKDAQNITFNNQNCITYSVKNAADYGVSEFSLNDGIEANFNFKGKEFHAKSRLIGLFNLYNLLAALACVNELVSPDFKALQSAINSFSGVSGRVEEVAPGVIVDFAHTPDGIEKVLEALSHKNLIVVFGAGGDRDRSKRAIMGKVAQKFASKLIITSDNPRSEEPNAIIKDILEGIMQDESVFIEPNRRLAIKKALNLRSINDLVVILGKGDENYQEIKGIKHPFSDKQVVRELLNLG